MADSQNPYAPPQSDLAADDQPRDDRVCFFHYRLSSRRLGNALFFALILYVTATSIATVVYEPVTLGQAIVPALLLGSIWLYLILIFLRPRVFEFRVGLKTIGWQRPWPNASSEMINVVDVERVEYDGARIALTTYDGSEFSPSQHTYGGASREVVEAITSAVKYQLPDISVRAESFSVWRKFGRYVQRFLGR